MAISWHLSLAQMCLLIPFLALSLPQSLNAEIRGSGTSVRRGKSICTFFCDYMSFFFTVSNFIIRNSDKVSKTNSHKIIITFSFFWLYYTVTSVNHMHVWVLSCFSRVQLCAILWTVAHQAPLSMGFSRKEHWSGLPGPPPGDLSDPGTEPMSVMSPVLADGTHLSTSATWEAPVNHTYFQFKFS